MPGGGVRGSFGPPRHPDPSPIREREHVGPGAMATARGAPWCAVAAHERTGQALTSLSQSHSEKTMCVEHRAAASHLGLGGLKVIMVNLY